MAQQSFTSFEKHRYLKWGSALTLLCVALYAIDQPPLKPNGGTWLGYGLGTLGALLILCLLAFGMRKRAYASRLGTVRGWLSAHVYLGLALAVIATLHAAFEFGWNIHTLAYVLTISVIASGVWGVILYRRQPALMGNLLDGRTLEDFGQALRDIDSECRKVAAGHPRLTALVEASAGGAIFSARWQRLTGRNPSCATLRVLGQLDARDGLDDQARRDVHTLQFRRFQQLKRIRNFMRMRTWTELWLMFHVPLSFALLMALTAHIIAVFFYW